MFVTWLPTFLKEHFSFDIKQVAGFGWVPYLFAAIGGLAGGFYSSMLIRNGMSPSRARKNAITIGAVIMLLSLAATAFYMDELKDHVNMAMILISATLFGFQFLINNLVSITCHDQFIGTCYI